MDEFSKSAMVALLPITDDWCKIPLPHMTLVYAGEIDKLKLSDFNELAKDACSIAQMSGPIQLRVTSRELFGNWSDDPRNMVDVFRLQPTQELWAMRRMVDRWNASEHPFNPHVTIGPTGSVVEDPPRYLAFDRILVGWGNDYLTFWLKRRV